MIDIDLEHFENEEQLSIQKDKILRTLSIKLNVDVYPTVLHTGKGYHIYQPIDGIVFEKYQEFYDFLPYLEGKDLTTEFLRFAEKTISGGKADPNHNPSINNCMLRVPGTYNSKNYKQVTICQRWNGTRPTIHYIAREFYLYLIQKRIDKIKERRRMSNFRTAYLSYNKSDVTKFEWIEKLLQTPINDYRKFCLWCILCPYVINAKRLAKDEATVILGEWLRNCSSIRNTDFNHFAYIKNDLRRVGSYWPYGPEKLKQKWPKVYHLLNSKNVFNKNPSNIR